jgi:catechol 2,3-dioxygenase-like lactoylglutathione lyase family enzyme
MGSIKNLDHVGVTVGDLEAAIAFFTALGLELEGRTGIEGEFLDTVIGMTGAKTEIAMLRAPGGGSALELSSFERPDAVPGPAENEANVLGLRSLAFEVTDLPSVVATLAADGHPTVGGIGEHEGTWRMAYVRGPEGILVALADRIDG